MLSTCKSWIHKLLGGNKLQFNHMDFQIPNALGNSKILHKMSEICASAKKRIHH
jgi:hypothetical protein